MSFEESASGGGRERRSWLPEAEILSFPAHRIIRKQPGHRGDEVAVTYHGETIVFGSPEAMYASARENDPLARAAEAELDADRAGVARLQEQANAAIEAARDLRRIYERRINRLAQAALGLVLLAGAALILGALA